MDWYYALNNQQLGPVSRAELDRLVRDGSITEETLVWQAGLPSWVAYRTTTGAISNPATVTPGADGTPAAEADTEVCVVSGKRYPKREMLQYEGKWISAEHREAFFQGLREGAVSPTGFTYGNFGRRFVAKFIDGVITAILNVPLNMLWSFLLLGSWNYFRPDMSAAGDPAFVTRMFAYQAASFISNLAVGLLYQWYFLTRHAATPGKLALGLKVVRADGSPLSTGRIIGRYFAEIVSSLILFIGYIMAGFDDQRRTLHDRICDTRVIKPSSK